ncbi:Med26 domain-containing protein [Cephalotus follicularis]|uniref:Med26 domain-containing protein n=1 Tax=Cephalotus follicularis TaxID=3775 RepID=A0A1Q3CGB8_CEPFO|nr:Med26 domain-containing protein [Cephalotus follicularis]
MNNMMDLDDFRSILDTAGVDVWAFIDTAILVASLDYGLELKQRRDQIVERLYASSISTLCKNCDEFDAAAVAAVAGGGRANKLQVKSPVEKDTCHDEGKGGTSPLTPQSLSGDDEDDLDPYGGLFDDEQKRVLDIKDHLEDPDQSEDSLVDLLQSLADMDITFKALKETDIGRHVNRLRKHPSNDVRRLVKQLVRKWKEIVDEWVKLNAPGEVASSVLMVDGDSPQQKIPQNGHHQVPDFAYSPNPHNVSSGSDKNNSEVERKPKAIIPGKGAPTKPSQSANVSASASHNAQRQRQQKEHEEEKDSNFDSERLASARKRLQMNYKEAENAKKQRTIQVMDIHEIPKPKNTFFGKNKGGGFQGRHW